MILDTPPIRIPFAPPFLFDCRLRGCDGSARRMGLGDQIVLAAFVQNVARIVGGSLVDVVYDARYPGATDVWDMSRLNACPLPGEEELKAPGYTVVPMRNHILESPIGRGGPCTYGEHQGYPGAQIAFNLGWQDIVPWRPVEIVLDPFDEGRMAALDHLSQIDGGTVIACQPIEVSRENQTATADLWRAVLVDLNRRYYQARFVVGCAPHQRQQAVTFMASTGIPLPVWTLCDTLPVWTAILGRAQHIVTGNTSGLWLGLSTPTPMTVVGDAGARGSHSRMWDVKPSWLSPERQKSVWLVRWQHFPNTLPVPVISCMESPQVVRQLKP